MSLNFPLEQNTYFLNYFDNFFIINLTFFTILVEDIADCPVSVQCSAFDVRTKLLTMSLLRHLMGLSYIVLCHIGLVSGSKEAGAISSS